MKKLFVLLGATIVVTILSAAAMKDRGPQRYGMKGAPYGMGIHANDSIMSAIKNERLKFDQYLTKKEKEKVQELRNRLDKLKEEGVALRKQRWEKAANNDKPGRPAFTDEELAVWQKHKLEQRKIMNEAFEIAYAHQSELQSSLKELAGIRQQYRSEWSKQRPANGRDNFRDGKGNNSDNFRGRHQPQGYGNQRPYGKGLHQNFDGRGRNHMAFAGRLQQPEHFVLLDPNKEYKRDENKK